MFKKKVAILAFLSTLLISSTAMAAPSLTVVIDSQKLETDVSPTIVNDRVLVPLRAISENMGAVIDWDRIERKIEIKLEDTHIILKIDDEMAYSNGEYIKLEQPAQIIESRTMVPVRFVSELMGAKVEWDNDNRMAVIRTDKQEVGNINTEDGFRYSGDILEGVPNGYGVIYDPNSNYIYRGEFKYGYYSGQGVLYYPSGSQKYNGIFEYGIPEEYGEFYSENGNVVYYGEIHQGKRQGHGVMMGENGVINYEGNFEDDEASGQGILFHSNGNKAYEGEFKNNYPNGEVTIYDKDGNVLYVGQVVNGEPV